VLSKNPNFGARLKALRQARGLTAKRFAEMAGYAPSNQTRYEQGTGWPSVWTARAQAGVLGIDTDEFLKLVGTEEDDVVQQVSADSLFESRLARFREACASVPPPMQDAYISACVQLAIAFSSTWHVGLAR